MNEDEFESGWYSDDAATFGDRLAGAREAAGLSQDELAAKLGVKTQTLVAWENDLKEPRANRLTMLSGLLGISLSWLMTGTGEGIDAPDDPASMPSDLAGLLSEIRLVRSEITQSGHRLARLEKRVRQSLRETA